MNRKERIIEVRKEMQGFGSWHIEQWYSYLKQLDEDVRNQASEDMKNGIILR